MKKIVLMACLVSACATFRSAPPPKEVVLEILNAQAQEMTVTYTSNGTSTSLGSVAARDTRRWALPSSKKTVVLTATDADGHTFRKQLNLAEGPVVRWEIRE